MAADNHVGVGGTFTTDLAGHPTDFLVTGIASSGRVLGNLVMMTTAAYQRLDPSFVHHSIAIYATGDRAALMNQIAQTYRPDLLQVVDANADVQTQLSVYLAALAVIRVVVMVLTCGLTLLVIGLVVNSTLVRMRREFGIMRAVGFTNAELAAQLCWAVMGAVIVGTVCGARWSAL